MAEQLISPLTLRERTLLDRVARGWSFEEIQKELKTSDIEVKRLCSGAMGKLDKKTIAAAACYATWRGWILPFELPVTKGGR